MTVAKKAAVATCALWALLLLAQRPGKPPAPPAAPEEVTISELSDWFAGVTFSHAAHASLAGDCGGCHHHGDGAVLPCRTCHPRQGAFDAGAPPPLNQALHAQCLGCHRESGGGPTGCEDCHARRRLPQGPALSPGPGRG